MNDWFLPLLTIVLPVISGVVAWFAGTRKRKNDFLSDLQSSIDLLSKKYTEALNELTILRKENNDLQVMQHELLCSIRRLEAENKGLVKVIDDLNTKLDKVKSITRSK